MSEPNYRWRPATKGDIGSVARFGDTDHKHEPWGYGILREIHDTEDSPTGFVYIYDPGPVYDEELMSSYCCQIQYDANKEP